MNSLAPYFDSAIFNSSAFYTSQSYLTQEEADQLYLSLSSTLVGYLTGLSAGTVLASKLVLVDSNKDITGFNNLTSNNQIIVNRPSNGECVIATNSNSRVAIHCLSNSSHIGTTTNTNFNIQANNSNVLQCLSTGNVNIVNHNGSTLGLQLNGSLVTASATELNYLSNVTAGTISASKAIVVDSNSNINSILNLKKTASSLQMSFVNGTSTASIYHFLNSDFYFGTTSANNLVFQTSGIQRVTINSSGLMSLANGIDIGGGFAISGTSVTSSATELNYVDITTIGTAEASKALILDSNRDISNIRNLTATNLTGTLQTASQTNITSVGTLTSLSTGSLTLNGTAITATATELNYNDITTIGTAEASKALIVDSNKDIQSIRRLHLSNISIGTLDYSVTTRLISCIDNTVTNGTSRYLTLGKAYSNYNSAEWGYFHNSDGSTSNRQEFGFYGANGIFAIIASRKVGINTTAPDKSLEVNSSTGDCLRLTYNDSNGSAVYYTDLTVDSTGALTIQPCTNLSVTANTFIKSPLIIGNNSDLNLIKFNGTTGDTGSNNYTVIAERIYTGGSEQSELILFKGNDTASPSGPDRIRLRGAEIVMQTYTSAEDFSLLSDNNDRLIIKNNGDIGIGRNPSYKLDVDGRIRSLVSGFGFSHQSVSGGGSELVSNSNGSVTGIGAYSNHPLELYTNNNARVVITAGGNVGLGTGTAGYQLELSTNSAAKPTSNAWTISSDQRIKEDIIDADLDICYNNVKNLKLKYYKWKDNFINNHSVDDHHKLGWIAQEVEQYFKKSVITQKNEKYNIQDFKSLDTDQIMASMYGAIQKLINKVEYLENFISELDIEEI